MLLSEIVYNIKNLMAGGLESDDSNVSDTQIAFMIGYYRAKLLKQDQEKGRFNIELYTQNLGKVSLIQSDKDCCESVCGLRTEKKIPKPLETHTGLNISYVGLSDGRPFTKIYSSTSFWSRGRKFTSKEPKWYYENGFIYILDPPTLMLDEIYIRGVFEDPYVAEHFKVCECPANNLDCSSVFETMDFEYSLPLHHVDTIVKLVAETELRILRSFPSDVTNDSLDQVLTLMKNAKGQ
jgi:hypothetical protein